MHTITNVLIIQPACVWCNFKHSPCQLHTK